MAQVKMRNTGNIRPVSSEKSNNAKSAVISARKTAESGLRNIKRRNESVREKIVCEKAKNDGKSITFSLIIFAVIVTSMFLLLVLNYAKEYELTVGISKLEKSISLLEAEQNNIDDETLAVLNSINFEEYTRETLGYVPKDQLSSKVICTERHDTVVISNDKKEENGFGILLSSLYTSIKNIFE